MTDNNENDVVNEVVDASSRSIKILLEMKPTGELQVSGPLDQPILMLGILEFAKETVLKIGRGEQKVKRQSNIVIPMVGMPKKVM